MKRIVGTFLTLVILGSLIVSPLAVMASTKLEHYITGRDTENAWYGDQWITQTFTTGEAQTATSVKLQLRRVGEPGVVTVSLRATLSGKPTGVDLCSGTVNGNTLTTEQPGDWTEVTLGAGAELLADTQYAIVIRALDGDATNNGRISADQSSPTYEDGWKLTSGNGGATWSHQTTVDLLFEVWGDAVLSMPEGTTLAATDVEYISELEWFVATLNGKVADDGGEACNVCFYYRVKDTGEWGYGGVTGNPYETDEFYECDLVALVAETTYEFFTRVWNEEYQDDGSVLEFTTEYEVSVPQVITYSYPMVKGENDCRIYGNIGYDGGSDCEAWFEYREKDTPPWVEQAVTNVIVNGGMEVGEPPDDWNVTGASATIARSGVELKEGDYSLLLTRSGADCYTDQDIPNYERYAGESVTSGVWAWASVASQTRLSLYDGVASAYSGYHTGGSSWEWLMVTLAVDASPTDMEVRGHIVTGDTGSYFDEAVLVRGTTCSSTGEYGEWLETTDGFATLLSGLDQMVDYEFRGVAENDEGIGYGAIGQFLLYGDIDLPEIRTDEVTRVRATEMTMWATVLDDGGQACWVWWEYREVGTSSWHKTSYYVGAVTDEEFLYEVEGLTPEVNYEYRAGIHNDAGDNYGVTRVVHTVERFRVPIILTNEAEYVGTSSLKLCSTLDYDGGYVCSVWFQYRLIGEGSWLETVVVEGVETGQDVEIVIFDLRHGFWYEYRALSENELGMGFGVVLSTCVVADEEEAPAEPLDPLGWLDDWLGKLGFNNQGGHWLVLIVVMAVSFAVFYRSEVIRVVVPLAWVGMAIATAWIELWLVLLLALGAGVAVFTILRKQIAGGG